MISINLGSGVWGKEITMELDEIRMIFSLVVSVLLERSGLLNPITTLEEQG